MWFLFFSQKNSPANQDFNFPSDDDKASFQERRSVNLRPGDVIVYEKEVIIPNARPGNF